jgi:signal transduction histidine kinase
MEKAVTAERSRLARELHDAVTQTLFSASLIAEILPRLWAKDPERGQQQLEEVRLLTRGALAEMRSLLLELRPEALAKAKMDDLLRQLGRAMTGRTGVPVSVSADVQCPLPAEVQIAFYRIAQEALNNTAKHAEASQVEVRFRCEAGQAGLSIYDNGRGFRIQNVPPGHFGVGIMRERAASVDAELEIESEPGSGTKVSVVWTADEG